jgi:hypothetical protein
MNKHYATGIRMTETGEDLLKQLSQVLGISHSAVFELAIRRLAGLEGVISRVHLAPVGGREVVE